MIQYASPPLACENLRHPVNNSGAIPYKYDGFYHLLLTGVSSYKKTGLLIFQDAFYSDTNIMTVPSSTNGDQQEEQTPPVTIPIQKSRLPKGGKRRRTPSKSPFSPIRKIIFSVLLIFLLYTILGFFVAPLFITSFVSAHLEKEINRSVTIGSATVNPFKFDIVLKNGIIGANKNNPEDSVDPLFSFGRLKIKLQPQAFFTKKLPIQAIHGNSVFLHIVRNTNEQLNLQQLINKTNDSITLTPKSITRRLQQIDIKLTDTKIVFEDRKSETTHTISEISLRLPTEREQDNSPYFSALINGSPIKIGQLQGQTSNENQSFDLHLKDINLPSYLNYLPTPFPQLISKGKANLDINIITDSQSKNFNVLLSGTGVAQDILVNDDQGNHNKIDSATFNFSANTLDRKIIFHKLVLETPELHVNRNKDGQFFFPAKNTFIKKSPSGNISIENVVIKKGKLIFIDKNVSGGFGAGFNDINLNIAKDTNTNITTYGLNCITNRKTRIASQGTVTTNPWQIKGLLIINDLPLAALNCYLTPPQGINITSGIVDKFETTFTLSPQHLQEITDLAQTTAHIKNLGLHFQGKEILNIPATQISKAFYSSKQHIASLGDLQIKGGRFYLTPTSPVPVPAYQPEQKQVLWKIDHLNITRSMAHLRGFRFSDTPQTIVITELNSTNISADPREKAQVKTSLTLLKSALWSAQGTVQFNPFRGSLQSKIDHVTLANIPPPLLKWLKPPLLNGSLSARGDFAFPDLSFTGTSVLQDFKLRYGKQHELLTIKKLNMEGGTYILSPPQVHIKQVHVDKLATTLSITRKKLFNRTNFFTEKKAELPEEQTHVSIDAITFHNNQFTFHDQITKPVFAYTIMQTNGLIENIDSNKETQTTFNFTGTGTDQTRFSLKGSTRLFTDIFATDLNITIKDFPLTTIKPFIEPITGYGIQGGFFNLDVNYLEDKGKMQSNTNLDIHDLTLTTKAKDNKHFPNIVALLTDSHHHINLNIPLNSNTTDPSYTFQSAYGKKLREFILATMVSPYSVLKEYFTDQTTPPNRIIFIPGTSQLAADQTDILLSLQTILKNRPLLHITIAGYSGSKEDRETLLKGKQAQAEKQDQAKALATGDALAKNYGKEPPPKPPAPPRPVLPPKKIQLTKQELQNLATSRSHQMKQILIHHYGIKSTRIQLNKPPTVVSQSDSGIQGHRVDFILSGTTH